MVIPMRECSETDSPTERELISGKTEIDTKANLETVIDRERVCS
jgi:hypothetical protein